MTLDLSARELSALAWVNVTLNTLMLMLAGYAFVIIRRAKLAIRELNNNIGWFRRNFHMDGNDGNSPYGDAELRGRPASSAERRSMPRT